MEGKIRVSYTVWHHLTESYPDHVWEQLAPKAREQKQDDVYNTAYEDTAAPGCGSSSSSTRISPWNQVSSSILTLVTLQLLTISLICTVNIGTLLTQNILKVLMVMTFQCVLYKMWWLYDSNILAAA